MYTPIDQKQIDQKIHQFMARKSPLKTLSKTVADRFLSTGHEAQDDATEIPYEKLGWHHTGETVFQSRFQKAH